MRRIIIPFILFAFLLFGCGTSEEQIQTAIAQTEAANSTATDTVTPTSTLTPPLTETPSQTYHLPASVRKMESLGYTFIYYSGDDPYWEAENSTEGWGFRVWEDGAFGMSGEFDKDYDAQTEASIDFFKSLDVSPDQASLTNKLIVESMGDSEAEAYGCLDGLCCNAEVVMQQELYIFFCSW